MSVRTCVCACVHVRVCERACVWVHLPLYYFGMRSDWHAGDRGVPIPSISATPSTRIRIGLTSLCSVSTLAFLGTAVESLNVSMDMSDKPPANTGALASSVNSALALFFHLEPVCNDLPL